MNKLAFAAVAAFALTAASAAFADDQIVQVGHGSAILVHADQATARAGNLAGDTVTVNYGPSTMTLPAGTAVVSRGATQLVRTGNAAPSETVISFGPARYTAG